MRKRNIVERIYEIKYSWKGHKHRNRHKNRIKRSGQAWLVYVENITATSPPREGERGRKNQTYIEWVCLLSLRKNPFSILSFPHQVTSPLLLVPVYLGRSQWLEKPKPWFVPRCLIIHELVKQMVSPFFPNLSRHHWLTFKLSGAEVCGSVGFCVLFLYQHVFSVFSVVLWA